MSKAKMDERVVIDSNPFYIKEYLWKMNEELLQV